MKKFFLIVFIVFLGIIVFFSVSFFTTIFKSKFKINKYKNMPENKSINLVFITDKNYIMPLEVAIKSAIYNKNKNSKYNIFVIGVELGENDILQIENLKDKNSKIVVINQKDIYKHFNVSNNYVSKADLFKFNLANIFPKFDKILYLDCDVIANKDLSELYNIDLENNYAAVVEDVLIDNVKGKLKLDYYFNNGVMLLNLNKMRNENSDFILIFSKYYLDVNNFMTQDCFNIAFYQEVKNVSPKYNLMTTKFIKKNEKYLYEHFNIDKKRYKTIKEYIDNATVIHFTGDKKPWNTQNIELGYIWEKYSKLK